MYDLFEAVQKNDYDTLKKVSTDKRMSEDIRRNTLKMQHEYGLLPEKPPIILSSEMSGKDKVIIKVSYVLDGEERIMIYPVVLVNNEWVIDLADALPEGAVVLSDNYDSTKLEAGYFPYSGTLNIGVRYYVYYTITNSDKVATVQGFQSASGSFNASYGMFFLNALGEFTSTGKPASIIKQNNYDPYGFVQTFSQLWGTNIILAMEICTTRNNTAVSGHIYDGY